MAGQRRRLDAWKLSVQTLDAARTQDWDPVLDGYARGVEAMMSRDDQLTVDSWLWAANTHGIPDGTASKPLWDECAHFRRFFLPWHRAYLAWFESTIQGLIKDPNWALPYWDYSDPDRPATLKLPPEFLVDQRTVDGNLVDNPLYIGGSERTGHPTAAHVDLVPAMAERFFLRRRPFTGFGGVDGARETAGLLELQPHNYIHTDVGGPSGLMSFTSVAARDPIFWVHHANIDRLWEVWRALPGSVDLLDQGGVSGQIVTEWRRAHFAFGGNKTITVYSIDDVLQTTTPRLNYEYEVTDLPQTVLTAVTAARREESPPMALDESTPREQRWDPVAATEQSTDVGEAGTEDQLLFDSRQLGMVEEIPSGLVIELAGVRAAVDCHNVYVVDVAAGPGRPAHRAGEFNTFGLNGTPPEEQRDYLVDATAVIPALQADGWNGRQVVVGVHPESPAAEGAHTPQGLQIGQITVYRQR
jgi:tyrosinase